MRNMSFSATTEQMRDGSKTVTRRIDAKGFYMRVLNPGTLVCAVEKGMGLKKGETIQRIGVIEIVDVRREPLAERIVGRNNAHPSGVVLVPPEYFRTYEVGAALAAEGFPEMPSWNHFADLFCKVNRIDAWLGGVDIEVTRIEFKHRPDLSPCCGGEKRVHPPHGDQGTTRHYVCVNCGEPV